MQLTKILFILMLLSIAGASKNYNIFTQIKNSVRNWSIKFSALLTTHSEKTTHYEKLFEAFNKPNKAKLKHKKGSTLVESIARNIRLMMDRKTESVQKIADYAEFLSYYRNNDSNVEDYYFFDADTINEIEMDTKQINKVENEINKAECSWWCEQKDLKTISNSFNNLEILFKRKKYNDKNNCDCLNLVPREANSSFYFHLPLEEKKGFNVKVNMNVSVIKTIANIYTREKDILEGAQWSEALDFVFKDNLLKDPSLTWQYFASPRGFMRHYPGIQWSKERYYSTYDFRMRTWYTEAMTSPKDVIILFDRSGSIDGKNSVLARHIVNDILDTLNDNDFVNIYTFANSTDPLVPCFNNTLVQANEENLRLLRESLEEFDKLEFVADVPLALTKAFAILDDFRNSGRSSDCNQAVMLITQGLDQPDPELFKKLNWDKKTPVRIFTYQIGNDPDDAYNLEWIACSNMGYYVNISTLPDVREKVLNYLNVMSRPINYQFGNKQRPIWSYLHVDLADRRFSNWLWKKFEGNRQREVFIDHIKRNVLREEKMFTSEKFLLLRESHDYEQYKVHKDYDYMTSVSLPVYGRREGENELLGVAGVDVPIKLFKALIPYHELGVNGYAFICTNNGYILIHPDHQTEFENILKPTFNRVDLLEVEIMNDNNEPRLFNKEIVELREKVVNHTYAEHTVDIKFTLYDMKRILLSKRHYYLTKIGPFTLGIVLPDKYGNVMIETPKIASAIALSRTENWKVHPDWIYCTKCQGDTPEEKIRHELKTAGPRTDLFLNLVYDADITDWFGNNENLLRSVNPMLIKKIFVSTRSGLTRWHTFKYPNETSKEEVKSFEDRHARSIDEDWYKRAVEENYADENKFIYSVPFEMISGFEDNTLITATKTIFFKDPKTKEKVPVAVVGLQLNHSAIHDLYNDITTKCEAPCKYTCQSSALECFILDNNAYIILSDEEEYTGRYIGDIRPDVMSHLVKDKVYIPTRTFDYQSICQYKLESSSSTSTRLLYWWQQIWNNLIGIFNWLTVLLITLQESLAEKKYQSIKPTTLMFETLEIKKTYPTPCDKEVWLFTLGTNFSSGKFNNEASKFDCDWPYIVEKIPLTNLLFLAINGNCKITTQNTYRNTPEPKEITDKYHTKLPCYIAIKNNYTRRMYMKCYKRHEKEKSLTSRFYCGHTWED